MGGIGGREGRLKGESHWVERNKVAWRKGWVGGWRRRKRKWARRRGEDIKWRKGERHKRRGKEREKEVREAKGRGQ